MIITSLTESSTYKSLCTAVILLILCGCQSLKTVDYPADPKQIGPLAQLASWQAAGKLSVIYQGENNSAQFQWKQKQADYTLHLFGPFGQGSTWLRKTGDLVEFESPNTGTQQAKHAEELLELNLGWQMPVSNMHFWLRGLAAPSPPADLTTLSSGGFLEQLYQQGWQVQYRSYQSANGWWLPKKIVAKRDSVKLTVVIKEWKLKARPKVL